ncbi:hypothetical protein JCM11641_001727 [Rhodosporidiobolus odoratus]
MLGYYQPTTVEVGPPAQPGQSRTRRYHATADKLVDSPSPEVKVIADLLAHSVKTRPDNEAVGWREVVQVHIEEKEVTKNVGGKEVKEKKSWQYFELSPYKTMTYRELGAHVKDAASALVKLGHTRETIFNIYSQTGVHWQVMANACATQGITFATAYDSLGESGLEHSLLEPSVHGVFTNAALLPTLSAVLSRTPSVKVLIYDGSPREFSLPATSRALDKIKQERPDVKLVVWDDFVKLGGAYPKEPQLPKPEDTALIMYTSGSTGAPKGVELTNANVVAVVAGTMAMVQQLITPDARFIAFLPLAHIFEFAVELTILHVGIVMGYGTVKTLSDLSVRNCVGDIREWKPTIMVGVPAVWEQIRKGILSKAAASGKVANAVFHGSLSLKHYTRGIPLFGRFVGGVLDAVVFKAVKQGTGGKLKYVVNGGAGLSVSTHEFLQNTITPYTIQGYGGTETAAISVVCPPWIAQAGIIGVPTPAVEIQLRDFEEAGYLVTNDPPQGEICLRGPTVMKSYCKVSLLSSLIGSGIWRRTDDRDEPRVKQPELTKEAITEDGWYLTGDIGQLNSDGTYSVIDRKKNLVKLQGGEYIALERLESILKSCSYVSNIMVHADPNASRPMAIVVPHESNLKNLLRSNPSLLRDSVPDGSVDKADWTADVCRNEKVRKAVLDDLNAVGKKSGLKPLEQLQTVVLCPEEWTPQNGFLTAAQKLQRKLIVKEYEEEIEANYP